MKYRSGTEYIKIIQVIVRIQKAAAIGEIIGAAPQQPFFIVVDKDQFFPKSALIFEPEIQVDADDEPRCLCDREDQPSDGELPEKKPKRENKRPEKQQPQQRQAIGFSTDRSQPVIIRMNGRFIKSS